MSKFEFSNVLFLSRKFIFYGIYKITSLLLGLLVQFRAFEYGWLVGPIEKITMQAYLYWQWHNNSSIKIFGPVSNFYISDSNWKKKYAGKFFRKNVLSSLTIDPGSDFLSGVRFLYFRYWKNSYQINCQNISI